MTTYPAIAQRPQVQKAAHTDAAHIAAVLGRAFFDDPVFRWIVPDDDRRRRITPEFFRIYNTTLLSYDETYIDRNGAGVVLWAPPGRPPIDDTDDSVEGTMDDLFGVDVARLDEIVALLDEHHPDGPPHYHLQWAGVEPDRQGQGIGSALLTPVLQRCDRDQVPAYLDATSPRNKQLYERHGFRVLDEIAPASGPPLVRMWRDPATT